MQSSETIKKRLKPILKPPAFGCHYVFKETIWTLFHPPIKRVALIRDLIKKSTEISVMVDPLVPLCYRFRNLLKKVSKGTEGDKCSREDRVESFLRVISISLLFPYTTG